MRPATSATRTSGAATQNQASRQAASWVAQGAQFMVSGGLATTGHWATMALLIQAGLPPLYATTAGAVIGSIVNYVLQFYWTFSGRSLHRLALPAYLCTVIAAWCANAGVFHVLAAVAGTGIGLAQLIATTAVAAMNFILYKRIVFHERSA